MIKNEDPEIESSQLSGPLTSEGATVDVQIFRVSCSNERWILRVTNEQNISKVWDKTFATDRDAYAEFYRDGIESLTD